MTQVMINPTPLVHSTTATIPMASPEWSGRFSPLNAELGVLLIALGDQRKHQFPADWRPVPEAPLYLADAEVWFLVRG